MSAPTKSQGWRGRLRGVASLAARPRPVVGVDVSATPAEVVHRENKWRLLRYHPRPEGLAHRVPVLLIPSLINRHYVLDLMPSKSFIGGLVARGHDVFCIDWGTPSAEDRYLSFDDIVDGYIGRAIRRTSRAAGVPRPHVLGYCMGGTLVAIHAAAHPDALASFTAMAAPVAFTDEGLLRTWTNVPGFDLGMLVGGFGNIPAPLMQSAFQLLRPTLPLAKAVNLWDRAWNDRYLDGFLALETWSKDNVSLPGAFYRTYIEALYRQDRLAQGDMLLSGRPARLDALRCPLHLVSFTHDHIAPPESCEPLLTLAGSSDTLLTRVDGSHVGGVTSRVASRALWPTLSEFWARRDTAAP